MARRRSHKQLAPVTPGYAWTRSTDEHGETVVAVDQKRLPTPERLLACNWVSADAERDTVHLAFGQLLPGGGKLVAVLIVSMSRESIHSLLFHEESSFLSKIRAYCAKASFKPKTNPWTPEMMPSDRMVFERATIAACTYVNQEAEIRFYRTSPSELRAASEGGSPQVVYPVVEISLSTEDLASLVERLAEVLGEGR